MCGLTGFCDFNKNLTKEHLAIANNILQHRGPDHGDITVLDANEATIGLGHRRLSIIDITAKGNQPMYSADKSIVIIFNGEVYNFNEIRKELITLGHSFLTDSDTEVIIKAYQQYGISAVNKFNGMFAFALYDTKAKIIYLLRDRAGVKPLYYFYKNDCVIFASELKSIYSYPVFEKEINKEAVSLFFKYGYIRAPHTIFENAFKVEPGHYVKIDISRKRIDNIKYYDVLDFYNKEKLKITEKEAFEELNKLLISAFQYRMISDVPVGVFLSGGFDSSVVAALLQHNSKNKLNTFTIGFNERKYNEAPEAKKIAQYLGTNHHEHYCTTKEAQNILPLLADIYDEPFGDSSAIPTTLVSQFARQHVTVSLSADGGDEIFAGYNRYQHLVKINNLLSTSPYVISNLVKILSRDVFNGIPILKKNKRKLNKLSEIFANQGSHGIADTLSKHYTNKELLKLLPEFDSKIELYNDIGKINSKNDYINSCLALDYKTYMVDDILVKVDRATMSVGLEGREPFLDNRIIEFVSQLPSDLKYKRREKKYILKKIAYKYIPKELLDRPKSGFSIPVHEWLKTDLKGYLIHYINEEQLSKHNLIDIETAISIRDEFLEGRNNSETKVWLLLIFQMWWNRWM